MNVFLLFSTPLNFRYLFILFIITFSALISETANTNCTTGYIKNELSYNKTYCCSYICEDKLSPRYNLNYCCTSTCSIYYQRICKTGSADLTSLSTTCAPTAVTSSLAITTSVPAANTGVPAPITNAPAATTKTVVGSSKQIEITTKTVVLHQKSLAVEYLPRFNKIKPYLEKFPKIITEEIFSQQQQKLLTATAVSSTNYSTLVTIQPPDNTYVVYISAAICIIAALVVIGCTLMIWRLGRKKLKKSFLKENKLRHSNKSKHDVESNETDACLLTVDVKPASQQQSEISFLTEEPQKRTSKLVLDIDIETYFKTIDVGIPENINSSTNPLCSLNKQLHPDHIIVHERLGYGFFGQVLKGIWHNNGMLDPGIEVALKTPNPNGQFSCDFDIYCLQLELKILSFVGLHPNIIQLLGVISKPCRIGNFVIATEFCHFGDLRSYIEKQKATQEVFVLDRPINELETILERNSICIPALLMYALQIANGAHFLSYHKTVIHRDLALRNMLLTKDHVVKIGDFGLAVNESAYEVKTRKMLPTRWLAPESLNGINAVFTAKSDIWSFGVLLWELFSLASDPLKIETAPKDREQFRQWLLSGNRFGRPKWAPDLIFDMMTQCWRYEPECRPTFLQCRTQIKNHLLKFSIEVYEYIAEKISLKEELS